jgi:predicted HicB family RNase H-like nuclease
MNKKEFERKLNAIEEIAPDDFDKQLIIEAREQNNNEIKSLNDFKTLMDYNGKLSLRIPRSLHMSLVEHAKTEGVSLNQFALYKLSR